MKNILIPSLYLFAFTRFLSAEPDFELVDYPSASDTFEGLSIPGSAGFEELSKDTIELKEEKDERSTDSTYHFDLDSNDLWNLCARPIITKDTLEQYLTEHSKRSGIEDREVKIYLNHSNLTRSAFFHLLNFIKSYNYDLTISLRNTGLTKEDLLSLFDIIKFRGMRTKKSLRLDISANPFNEELYFSHIQALYHEESPYPVIPLHAVTYYQDVSIEGIYPSTLTTYKYDNRFALFEAPLNITINCGYRDISKKTVISQMFYEDLLLFAQRRIIDTITVQNLDKKTEEVLKEVMRKAPPSTLALHMYDGSVQGFFDLISEASLADEEGQGVKKLEIILRYHGRKGPIYDHDLRLLEDALQKTKAKIQEVLFVDTNLNGLVQQTLSSLKTSKTIRAIKFCDNSFEQNDVNDLMVFLPKLKLKNSALSLVEIESVKYPLIITPELFEEVKGVKVTLHHIQMPLPWKLKSYVNWRYELAERYINALHDKGKKEIETFNKIGFRRSDFIVEIIRYAAKTSQLGLLLPSFLPKAYLNKKAYTIGLMYALKIKNRDVIKYLIQEAPFITDNSVYLNFFPNLREGVLRKCSGLSINPIEFAIAMNHPEQFIYLLELADVYNARINHNYYIQRLNNDDQYRALRKNGLPTNPAILSSLEQRKPSSISPYLEQAEKAARKIESWMRDIRGSFRGILRSAPHSIWGKD